MKAQELNKKPTLATDVPTCPETLRRTAYIKRLEIEVMLMSDQMKDMYAYIDQLEKALETFPAIKEVM